MFGPEPDTDEADQTIEEWSAQHELRLETFLLVLPGAVGLFLLMNGITDRVYVQIGIGLLLIALTPFLARRVVRKSEFLPRDD